MTNATFAINLLIAFSVVLAGGFAFAFAISWALKYRNKLQMKKLQDKWDNDSLNNR